MSYATKRPVERRLAKRSAANLSLDDIRRAEACGYKFPPSLVLGMMYEKGRLKVALMGLRK